MEEPLDGVSAARAHHGQSSMQVKPVRAMGLTPTVYACAMLALLGCSPSTVQSSFWRECCKVHAPWRTSATCLRCAQRFGRAACAQAACASQSTYKPYEGKPIHAQATGASRSTYDPHAHKLGVQANPRTTHMHASYVCKPINVQPT